MRGVHVPDLEGQQDQMEIFQNLSHLLSHPMHAMQVQEKCALFTVGQDIMCLQGLPGTLCHDMGWQIHAANIFGEAHGCQCCA